MLKTLACLFFIDCPIYTKVTLYYTAITFLKVFDGSFYLSFQDSLAEEFFP